MVVFSPLCVPRRHGQMAKDPDKDPIEVCLVIRHDDEVRREFQIGQAVFIPGIGADEDVVEWDGGVGC